MGEMGSGLTPYSLESISYRHTDLTQVKGLYKIWNNLFTGEDMIHCMQARGAIPPDSITSP